jgi:hypothetical protein
MVTIIDGSSTDLNNLPYVKTVRGFSPDNTGNVNELGYQPLPTWFNNDITTLPNGRYLLNGYQLTQNAPIIGNFLNSNNWTFMKSSVTIVGNSVTFVLDSSDISRNGGYINSFVGNIFDYSPEIELKCNITSFNWEITRGWLRYTLNAGGNFGVWITNGASCLLSAGNTFSINLSQAYVKTACSANNNYKLCDFNSGFFTTDSCYSPVTSLYGASGQEYALRIVPNEIDIRSYTALSAQTTNAIVFHQNFCSTLIR